MVNPNDFLVAKAHREEMERRAAMEQLALDAKENTVPAHKALMAKVGKALVTIGTHLEAQGGVVVNVHGDSMTPSSPY